jgi:hypothetical protein
VYELEYFLLQLDFARRAGIVCGLPFEEAAMGFTSFVRQFRERGCVWKPEWGYDNPRQSWLGLSSTFIVETSWRRHPARLTQRSSFAAPLCKRSSRSRVSPLYHLQAYSRLFPTAFIESAQTTPRWFSSGARWGQVATGDGHLRKGIAPALLSSASAAIDIDMLDRCFEFSVLSLRAPLSVFVDFYHSPR